MRIRNIKSNVLRLLGYSLDNWCKLVLEIIYLIFKTMYVKYNKWLQLHQIICFVIESERLWMMCNYIKMPFRTINESSIQIK